MQAGESEEAASMSATRSRGAPAEYGEASIRVLKGLEPVRQRPGMYTRTDSPLHIIQEVIDNSADEILAGFGSRIDVRVESDGAVSVEDDGRGIPVGNHPEEKAPVVEIVFTRLHAGGKFDKRAGGAYSFSGGLHGVGVSVTNALSSRLEVVVWRDRREHSIAFSGGDVVEPLRSRPLAATDKQSGTRVTVWPDAKYFDTARVSAEELERLLRSKAMLMPGTQVSLRVDGTGLERTWRFDGGLGDVRAPRVGRVDQVGATFPVARNDERIKLVVGGTQKVREDVTELDHSEVDALVFGRFEMRPMVAEVGRVGDVGAG